MSGSKILITRFGYEKVLQEYNYLKTVERVQVTKTIEWARSNGDLSENGDYIYAKRRLREIDERLDYISKRLSVYEVVDPVSVDEMVVTFGSLVTVLDLDTDHEHQFWIVGEDEIDPSKGYISYMSPIGRALMGKEVGALVDVETPKGVRSFEILKIGKKLDY